jgi:hypothetical protein
MAIEKIERRIIELRLLQVETCAQPIAIGSAVFGHNEVSDRVWQSRGVYLAALIQAGAP